MSSGSPCVNSRWDRRETGVASEVCVSRGSQDVSGAPQGGVEMAAAMAAKINAMLMAKGKLKPLQPLPSKAPPAAPLVSAEEIVVAEVDINDVAMECRNLLTRGKTQDEISQLSGALVSTKGLYMSDTDRSSSTGVRPLYLHVQGRSQENVNKAVARIKEIISEDVLRSSGGQQPAVMPTVPVYRQTLSAAPGHKPAPLHTGVRAEHTRIMSSYSSSSSAPVYSTHSAYSANNSYGGQSWYGYPSSYPTYPGAFWENSSAVSSQSQQSSGAVQYPVCKQSGFQLQGEDADSCSSPKQHSDEEEQKAQVSTDVSVKDISAADDSRTLMPPPAAPIRKRPREETCSSTLTHTAEEQLMMKKMKIPEESRSGSSGLVPYGGDSSDEEEERMRSGSKSTV
ncbi:KH homology domain-containing protein 4-like isoform X2 [Puntigrus tetrazona]|uniref:KH homology domain-containing protein 4-like isoform X2 n=1 Tax=Puntigrus tetrazona TaxID=1606681 RepID=UPI001C8A72C4|nr:KH homology domain-containing protein 4-like isoform X2 [Puntigrus tetrazona]